MLTLGCGDSNGEPIDDDGASESTSTTSSTTDTMSTLDTVGPGTLDSSGSDSTTATTTGVMGPEIEVSIDDQPVASGGSVETAPVDVGAMVTVTITVTNTGSASLELTGAVLDGALAHFVLDDTTAEPVVLPGASTSLTLVFAPSSGGRKSTQLTIENSDGDEGTYLVTFDARTTPNTYRLFEPRTSPAPRFNHGMAATGDGRVLVFGGRGADGLRLADTWVFDPETGEWTELMPASAPSARDALAMASVGEGVVVLFGGTETSGPGGMVTPRDDTWVFDLATEEWTELAPAASPPGRFQHALAPMGEGMAVLVGGRPEFNMEFADTWSFDRASETWTDLAPATDPGSRSAFAMAFDGVDTLAIVGGTVDSMMLTDQTWRYSVANNEWSAAAASPLGEQFNNAAAWVEGQFIVHSAKLDCCSDPVLGTWGYDPGADSWTELTPESEPAPRFSHEMVAVGSDKAILFGGLLLNANLGSATAETWEYVGP